MIIMETINIKLNGIKGELTATDTSLEVSVGFISIPYENIADINYSKGGLMSKSSLTVVYFENNNQNTLNIESKSGYNSTIVLLNKVKEHMAIAQSSFNSVNNQDFSIQNDVSQNSSQLIDNYNAQQVIDSISVSNGAIKGTLEIYENYYKVLYNDTFNIVYYNQMLNATKYKKSGNTYFAFTLRTDLNEPYEEHWLIQKLLKGKKVDNMLNHINSKIMQSNQNNDIQVIKVIAEPNSNNKIFFIGSTTDTKATLTGRTAKAYTTISYLEQDYLLIEKLSAFRKKGRGDKKVPYSNISSIDYDKPGTFGVTSGIDITLSGSDVIALKSIFDKSTQNFYTMLTKVVEEKKKPQPTQIIQQETTTNADELLKWHELYEKGVISEEEFNQKKKELL